MGAILKNDSVFLHVPKTGGNWVVEILKQHKLFDREFIHKHADIGRMQVIEDEVFTNKVFIFCFVRHPVTWMESWYKYQRQRKFKGWGKNGSRFYHPCSIIDDCQNKKFNTFVSNIIDKVPGFVSNMYFQYTRHSNYIGRQEHLHDGIIDILKALGKKPKYKKIFLSLKINESRYYPIVWDRKIKEEFQKMEISGIKQYGYQEIK